MFRLWCTNNNEWKKDSWVVLPNGIVLETKRNEEDV